MPDPRLPLLLELLPPGDEHRILILEGGAGDLGWEAARRVPRGEVLTLDRDIRAVLAAQKRLAGIPNAAASADVLPTPPSRRAEGVPVPAVETQPRGTWDVVLLPIPKERKFSRALLLAAWDALRPGGQLILAGPGKGGAKAVIRDAERLFGEANAQIYRRHQRAARCTRGETLPDLFSTPLNGYAQAGIAPGTRHFVELPRPEGTLTLETHPGIFSWEAVDEGTALLLENLTIKPGSRVWDVGCGYGAIGLSAALSGAAQVRMSDVNLLALRYARENARRHALADRVEILPADALALIPSPAIHHSPSATPHPTFDLIVSNPAFHQGRAVDKSMAAEIIARAPEFLASRGRLVLVANRFLPYDRLMRKHFPRVHKLTETTRYHVIEAVTWDSP